MEAVLFVGIQAAGKSTFYQQQFFKTHIRINLDMLKTRHRETRLLETCLAIKQPFVVDNTNPTRKERARYIMLAKTAEFHVTGYYFQTSITDALKRNQNRVEVIPEKAIRATRNRLELPALNEGFDTLYYVRLNEQNQFVIEGWKDEV